MTDSAPPLSSGPRTDAETPCPPPPDSLTLSRVLLAVVRSIRFYSRLPVPRLSSEADPHAIPDFRVEPVGLPFAAIVIALPAIVVGALCVALKLDPLITAALIVTALVITTGALHEDGLCDCADGLFGGHDVERRLAIMKDSRIGAFAGCALGLSLLLRVAALAAIVRIGGLDALIGAVLIGACVSRVEGVRVLATLPTARASGASAAVGRPSVRIVLITGMLALAVTVIVAIVCNLPVWGVMFALVLANLAVSALIGIARRLLGGQTGDVVGAAQQLAEIGIYIGLAAGLAQ